MYYSVIKGSCSLNLWFILSTAGYQLIGVMSWPVSGHMVEAPQYVRCIHAYTTGMVTMSPCTGQCIGQLRQGRVVNHLTS